MSESITAYMVVEANGSPALATDAGLRIKTRRADAELTVKFLDRLECERLPEYKSGPHKIIEVTITPKS